jgi:monothiol glutaredoxin
MANENLPKLAARRKSPGRLAAMVARVYLTRTPRDLGGARGCASARGARTSIMTNPDVQKYIAQLVANHRVLLFMKGNKSFPQCGFSAAVVEVLKRHGVPFETINVLQDQAVREGIKEFSRWPTIPQLYVDGEFVGGCDIVREMDANGELADKLQPKQ